MSVQLELGLNVIRSYKRLAYTAWHALAEFVDNSTQAYFNNREVLDNEFSRTGDHLEVAIVYDRDGDLIRISDNSIGMSDQDLAYALRVGATPAFSGGRSQFGMGMKTAACWLGDHWSVRTKKLGCTTEYTVEVDVDRVAEGNNDLPTTERTDLDPSDHYTVIEITRLNRKFHGRTLGKIRQFLESMYRVDLRDGTLRLRWQDALLTWEESDDRFVQAADGSRYKKDFSFEVNGKLVRGWIGILDFGHAGRPQAGFSILRRGRVIRGFPENWRPQSIFGQLEGSNNLINQRITGEIHLDDFEVSHTKDDILWMDDEEAEVLEKLAEIARPYVAVARNRRRADMQSTAGPSSLEIKAAVEELQSELSSSELVDLIEIEDVPPPEVIHKAIEPVLESVDRRSPAFSAKVGNLEVDGYLVGDGSPNDPYVAVDSTSDSRVIVVVNMRHPYISELVGSEGMLNYLRHCTFDAIAEWQAYRKTTVLDGDTFKMLKDRLLRLPSQVQVHSQDAAAINDGPAASIQSNSQR